MSVTVLVVSSCLNCVDCVFMSVTVLCFHVCDCVGCVFMSVIVCWLCLHVCDCVLVVSSCL